jgi:hypothetical protein
VAREATVLSAPPMASLGHRNEVAALGLACTVPNSNGGRGDLSSASTIIRSPFVMPVSVPSNGDVSKSESSQVALPEMTPPKRTESALPENDVPLLFPSRKVEVQGDRTSSPSPQRSPRGPHPKEGDISFGAFVVSEGESDDDDRPLPENHLSAELVKGLLSNRQIRPDTVVPSFCDPVPLTGGPPAARDLKLLSALPDASPDPGSCASPRSSASGSAAVTPQPSLLKDSESVSSPRNTGRLHLTDSLITGDTIGSTPRTPAPKRLCRTVPERRLVAYPRHVADWVDDQIRIRVKRIHFQSSPSPAPEPTSTDPPATASISASQNKREEAAWRNSEGLKITHAK